MGFMSSTGFLSQWPPLWSSGQSSWLQIQRPQVRFPTLRDFLRSSGSGTGPLSLVRVTKEILGWKSSGSGSKNPRLTAVGVRCVDHASPSPQKLALSSPTSGGRSVVIVRLRTKGTDFLMGFRKSCVFWVCLKRWLRVHPLTSCLLFWGELWFTTYM
jgi:hypothetical protein